jgi:hypothetical protein
MVGGGKKKEGEGEREGGRRGEQVGLIDLLREDKGRGGRGKEKGEGEGEGKKRHRSRSKGRRGGRRDTKKDTIKRRPTKGKGKEEEEEGGGSLDEDFTFVKRNLTLEENFEILKKKLQAPEFIPPALFLILLATPKGGEKKTVRILAQSKKTPLETSFFIKISEILFFF